MNNLTLMEPKDEEIEGPKPEPVKEFYTRAEVRQIAIDALYEKGAWYDEEVEEWLCKRNL